MKISVVITTFNSENTIERCLNSVANQTAKVSEIIVIDDFSTDNTVNIIKKRYPNVHLIVNEYNTGGPSFGRNLGISTASGELIALLDSDDEWYPDKIEYQSNQMIANKLLITCTNYEVYAGDVLEKYVVPPPIITFKNLLLQNLIGYSTVMFSSIIKNKFLFNNIGHEDYDLWLNILKNKASIESIPKSLTKYYRTKGSLSSNKLKVFSYYWKIYGKHSSSASERICMMIRMLYTKINNLK